METTTPLLEKNLGHVILRTLNDSEIEIDDSPRGQHSEFFCYRYFVGDTSDLDAIEAILKRPNWREDEINDVVAAMLATQRKLDEQEGE